MGEITAGNSFPELFYSDSCFFFPLDGGDKDARDSVQMWLEKRLRDGLEDGSTSRQQIGTFERYTKVSFGYRVDGERLHW